MVFGILEDHHLEKVPGTGLLTDLGIVHGNQIAINEAANLKRGTGRQSHIVLMPQPSDDPRDPLNWPRWRKEACFWTLAFAASLDGALSPLASAGYVLLSQKFNVSVDEITSSFGFILLGLGCFMFAQSALAVKYGHRIVYLVSVALMFISCMWCAASPNLISIRASRVFQGFGMSALQSLVASTLEQIYFIHERGSRNVIWSFSILAGITLGPLIYSFVIERMAWNLGFWFVSIPLGLCLILVFFFVPETTYTREPIPSNKSTSSTKEKSDSIDLEKTSASSEEITSIELLVPPPSFISQLKIWNGTFSNQNFFTIFLRPIPFVFSPVTIFIFFVHGMQTVWLSLVPLCSSTIFTLEYHFTASQIGLTNLGGLVGIVLGMIISGPLIDWGVVFMSRRNRGIYEPEFRLLFMSAMLFGVFGYVGWAVGNSNGMPWIGAVACIMLLNFSMIISGSAAVTYLLDAHGENALHCLAISNFSKNMVLYGSTFFANAFCFLFSIPMYIFGKRVRSFIARHSNFYTVKK
ncbi:MFS transporter superfamily protein [Abortiporus biennis]